MDVTLHGIRGRVCLNKWGENEVRDVKFEKNIFVYNSLITIITQPVEFQV